MLKEGDSEGGGVPKREEEMGGLVRRGRGEG